MNDNLVEINVIAFTLTVLVLALLLVVVLGLLVVMALEWWDNTPETTRINQVGVLSGLVMTGLTLHMFNF